MTTQHLIMRGSIRVKPIGFDALLLAGQARLNEGLPLAALRWFRKAAEHTASRRSEALQLCGVCLRMLRHYKKAGVAFEQALKGHDPYELNARLCAFCRRYGPGLALSLQNERSFWRDRQTTRDELGRSGCSLSPRGLQRYVFTKTSVCKRVLA